MANPADCLEIKQKELKVQHMKLESEKWQHQMLVQPLFLRATADYRVFVKH